MSDAIQHKLYETLADATTAAVAEAPNEIKEAPNVQARMAVALMQLAIRYFAETDAPEHIVRLAAETAIKHHYRGQIVRLV